MKDKKLGDPMVAMTDQQKKDLMGLIFGYRDPGSDFYQRLLCTSAAVHLDPVLAWQNVCRFYVWISNNNNYTPPQ